jgi:hypothetical protein
MFKKFKKRRNRTLKKNIKITKEEEKPREIENEIELSDDEIFEELKFNDNLPRTPPHSRMLVISTLETIEESIEHEPVQQEVDINSINKMYESFRLPIENLDPYYNAIKERKLALAKDADTKYKNWIKRREIQ